MNVQIPRRNVLTGGALSLAALLIDSGRHGFATPSCPLIEQVGALCRRLTPVGCRRILLEGTGGSLDITAADLRAEPAKPLNGIGRSCPGSGDCTLGSTQWGGGRRGPARCDRHRRRTPPAAQSPSPVRRPACGSIARTRGVHR